MKLEKMNIRIEKIYYYYLRTWIVNNKKPGLAMPGYKNFYLEKTTLPLFLSLYASKYHQ